MGDQREDRDRTARRGAAGATTRQDRKTRRPAVWVAAASFLALTLAHLDFWRPQQVRFVWGGVPEELAFRIAYCLLAWVWVLFVCSRVWREDGD